MFDILKNKAKTTLVQAHMAGDGKLYVVDASQFVAPTTVTCITGYNTIRSCLAVSAVDVTNNILTVTGAVDGTTDVSLGVNTAIRNYFLDKHYQDHSDAITMLQSGGSNQGDQGPQGFQGDRGYQGFQGAAGISGAVGSQGAQGSQGFQGAASTVAGPQGAAGQAGSPGASGAQGFQGPQGARGSDGVGSQGYQGNAGAQGPAGVGSQGYQGVAGQAGSQGPQGYQGAAGSGAGSSTPAGANGSVQYNNNGVIGGSLLFTGSTYPVEIGGSIEIDTVGNIQLFGGNSSVTTIGTTLKLGQTGGQFGSSFLTLTNGIGANGAVFSTVSPYALVDFGFLTSANIQSNFRYECRVGSVFASGNATYGEFQFVMDSTGSSFYFPLVFGTHDTIFYPQPGGSGAGYYAGRVGIRVDPQATLHIQPQSSETGFIVQGASGQTADLHQYQDSTGTVLSAIDPKGYMRSVVGSGAPTTTPPDGSMYLDNAAGNFYVRVNGSWKKTTLS